MDFLATIVLTSVVLVEVHGMNLFPSRQFLNYSMHLAPQAEEQKHPQSMLHLTPSQIRALLQREDQIDRPQMSHDDSVTQRYTPAYPQAAHQENQYQYSHHEENPRFQFVHPQPNTTPTVAQSETDPFRVVSPPNFRQPKSMAYNTSPTQNLRRLLKPASFLPEADKQRSRNIPKAETVQKKLPMKKPVENTDDEDQIARHRLKEQWLQILKQNIAHFKALEVMYQNQIMSQENKTNFHYLAQNDDRYNDKKYASEVYNLVRSNNENQLKKQRTVLFSEAVANAPPLPFDDDINMRHIPTPFTAHDAGPPIQEIFSVPEHFENKESQFYDVPVDVFRPMPYPNVKYTNEEDGRAPTEVERHIPFPATNNMYGDMPFMSHQVVAVENLASNQDSWRPYFRE